MTDRPVVDEPVVRKTVAPSVSAGNETCIWILGLIHSGTTIFWRCWRKDGRFLCLDEPFAPLTMLPKDGRKATRGELVELFQAETDPRTFWRRHAPLRPLQELDSGFTAGQEAWLRYLLTQSRRIVIDETHLHLHVHALAQLTPHAHVIHLYRRASGFVTSHLRPSWSRNTSWWRRAVRRLRRAYNKHVFWSRHDFPPGMRRDDVIGRHPLSKFGLMLDDAGYDARHIMAASSVVRLLAYWHYHYHYLEREGPRLFGQRFTRVRYEDFVADPELVMTRLYDWIGVAPPDQLSIPNVYRVKPPFRQRDRRWREAATAAGFTELELDTLL